MAVVIFKTIEKCVSSCLYCDVIKKKQNSVMPLSLLETVFTRIDSYLKNNPGEIVDVTWHGGEVCMLGEDYLNSAADIIDSVCSDTKSRIKHSVQSNLLPLNEKLIGVFKKMGIRHIGSSYDPIDGIRGVGKRVNSKVYKEKFFRAVRLLDYSNISWGVIYVVHRRSLEYAEDLFYTLTNLSPGAGLMFNKIYVYGDDIHNLDISQEEFAGFLGKIFRIWWPKRELWKGIKPFDSFYSYVTGRNRNLVCELSGNCSNKWVYIGPTGETSQCGRTGDYDYINYGNIQQKSLEEIFSHPFRDEIKKRQRILPENECKDCRFWGVCRGGCPVDAYYGKGTLNSKSDNCGWIKIFLEKYFEPVSGFRITEFAA